MLAKLAWWWLAAVLCGGCGDGDGAPEKPPRADPVQEAPRLPNLILFSADAMRVDHLSGSGYGRDTTPALAALARRAVVFNAAFTPFPDTLPAHGSMLTGLDPGTHGLLHEGTSLREDALTLAQLLHTQGYTTGGFVSLPRLGKGSGLERGFSVYDAPAGKRRPGGLTLLSALEWLRTVADADHPFFLFVQLADADLPYEPPAAHVHRLGGPTAVPDVEVPAATDTLDKEARVALIARYDASLSYVDHVLSTLVQQLVRQQISTRTSIVVASAHGVTLTERDWAFDHGARLYDEQLRVPLILRLGGGRHAGVNVGVPVSLKDVFPTLADLAEIESPASLPARSLMQMLEGGRVGAKRPIYSLARADARRVPHLGAPLDPESLVASVRVEGFKLIDYPLKGGNHVFELFDLGRDAEEQVNVLPEHPERVQELIRLLGAWRLGTGVMGPAGPTAAPR